MLVNINLRNFKDLKDKNKSINSIRTTPLLYIRITKEIIKAGEV
jgi:hypothetical protein